MRVVGDLRVHPGQLRHALQAALEHDPQLAAAQHGEVGALVRAREQVVDDAAQVVPVGLLGDGLAELGATAGTGRRAGARRRPRRTGWRARCRRSRRSCRASRPPRRRGRPPGARASSHVTRSAARAVLSPRCALVACMLSSEEEWTTRALHQRCTAARRPGRRTGRAAGRGTRAGRAGASTRRDRPRRTAVDPRPQRLGLVATSSRPGASRRRGARARGRRRAPPTTGSSGPG